MRIQFEPTDNGPWVNNNDPYSENSDAGQFVKLRIKHKLFLLLLGANLLLASGIFLINSWSFSAGFVEYINRTEQKRFLPFIAELAKEYRHHDNWLWVRHDHFKWRSLIDRYLHQDRGQFPAQAREQTPFRRLPPPPGSGHPRNPDHPGRRDRPGPPEGRKGPPSRRPTGSLSIDPRLLLMDAQRQLIMGPSRQPRGVHWLPIHDQGQLIGYLGFRRLQHLDEELNRLFAEQQTTSFLYAALGMVLISVLLSLPVAQRFVRPIQRLTGATKILAAGDYKIRFPEQRSDELGDLARNFNRLARTLAHNRHARQQWIADISHELRTPVAILRGEIEALQDGIRQANAQSLTSLHQEICRLNRLIDDLHELTLADLGALDYHKETLDLRDLIQPRVDAFDLKLADKQLQVRTHWKPQPYPIWGDERRLTQVFTNLMQNSVRYTDAGGSIQMTLQSGQGWHRLIWSDSEPGVATEHLSRLFDRLYRVERSRNRSQGGAGLGLAITEAIVQAHQGRIEARASKLGGLSIIIILPIHT